LVRLFKRDGNGKEDERRGEMKKSAEEEEE
jgi:hypothetical protein